MQLLKLGRLPESDGRLHGIELARFLAAFAVLLAHYGHFYMLGYTAENFSVFAQPLFAVFEPFYLYGTRAVEVFWCISGFIFLHQYRRAIFERAVTPRKFFWLRFSRLYPLHLATLLLVLVLQLLYRHAHGTFYVVHHNDARHFWLNLFMASHWGWQAGDSYNAAIWSVSLEILVYVFFFAAARLVRMSWVEVLVILGGCVAANHLLGREAVFSRCLFYFFLGGLVALVYDGVVKRRAGLGLWVLLGSAGLLAYAIVRFRATRDLDTWLLGCATPATLLGLALASGWFSHRWARVAEGLGNLTYSSYLIHFPIQLVVMLTVGALGLRRDFAASPWFLLGYLAVVLGLAHVTYRFFERPAREYVRRRAAR